MFRPLRRTGRIRLFGRGHDHRQARPVPGAGAVAVHDDADADRVLEVAVPPAAVVVAHRDDVAEPELLEAVLGERPLVVGLDLDAAALVHQTGPGADEKRRNLGGDRHGHAPGASGSTSRASSSCGEMLFSCTSV